MRYAYQFADGFQFPKGTQAGAVVAALRAINPAIDRITKEQVVAVAEDPSSALHALVFDKSAADALHAHALERAGYILRSVIRVEVSGGKVVKGSGQKVLIQLRKSDEPRVYHQRVRVLKESDARVMLVSQLWDELLSWTKRADDLVEFAPILKVIYRFARRKSA